nr:MAG TPA: hypothetical protein [Caudoviricetes sp.]
MQKQIRISIFESAESYEQLAEMLRHIAMQLDNGATEGFYPGWETTVEENDGA